MRETSTLHFVRGVAWLHCGRGFQKGILNSAKSLIKKGSRKKKGKMCFEVAVKLCKPKNVGDATASRALRSDMR